MSNSVLLSKCASFEHRGPIQASLSEVNGINVHVHRKATDWSDIVQGKPVVDNRCSELADLYPRPRNVLSQVLSGIKSQVSGPGAKPPSMR